MQGLADLGYRNHPFQLYLDVGPQIETTFPRSSSNTSSLSDRMARAVHFFVLILVTGAIESEPIVKTSIGTVSGKTETYDGVGIETFLGIPYAKPPVGELRFALPQAADNFGDLNATEYSAACPQAKLLPLPPSIESEDCLYLNIFRKAGTTPESKKPVIFLIHGGAFCLGSASQSFYNALPMTAIGDVVVVSINYRLGVLGFADMKDLIPGNLGLFDQLLALEWVHDNIAAFGGDPERVTLVGVSAGSMSVSALVNTPLIRGKNLFKQAVMDAGVMSQTMIMGEDLSLKRLRKTAAGVGCETEGEKMLSCLRSVNASQLVDASIDREFSPILTFAPTVDGKFIAVDPSKDTRENSDKFVDVRMIIGVAKDEGSFFAPFYQNSKTLKTENEFIDVTKEVSRGFLYPLDFDKQDVREAVAQTYFSKFEDYQRDVAEFIADGTFVCPTNAFVKNYAKAHNNVFVYNFEKVMNRKYLKLGPDNAGAYHGSPFSNMFGSFLAMPEEGEPLDAKDKQFTIDSVRLLAEFVNSDAVPKFRGVAWPNYSKGEGILIINEKSTVGKELVHQERCRKVFPFLESE